MGTCSRCSKNIPERWENCWPMYGMIRIGYHSCIDHQLLKSFPYVDLYEKNMERVVQSGSHPAIKKSRAQEIQLEWGVSDFDLDGIKNFHFKKDYRLCPDCQAELLAILGKFFFSNNPKRQPL